MRLRVRHSCHARRKFGGYKKEEPKRVASIKTRPNRKVEMLKRVWAECNYERYAEWKPIVNEYNNDPHQGIHTFHRKLRSTIKDLRITPRDIEQFSIAMKEYEHEESFSEKAGHFLSFFINHSRSRRFMVQTAHLDRPIDRFGFENRKHVTIKGSLGHRAGDSMKGGTVVVEGNVGNEAGVSCKGRLVIKGNAGGRLGEFMSDHGIIEIEGEFDSLGESARGRIYHKGKPVTDDWKPIDRWDRLGPMQHRIDQDDEY